MSKTSTRTDAAAVVSADILRESVTQDATGHFGGTSPTTVESGVQGDLQPRTGQVMKTEAGIDPRSDHVFIPLARIADIEERDLLEIAGKRYRVEFVGDWAATYPQEVYLKKLTNPEDS